MLEDGNWQEWIGNLTADYWEIFSDEPGAEDAAREMNQIAIREIKTAYRAAMDGGDLAEEAQAAVYRIQKGIEKFKNYGACDTEPQATARDIVQRAMNVENLSRF